MTRLLLLVLVAVLLPAWAGADDPPKKLTDEERKELAAKYSERETDGFKAYKAGRPADAVKAVEEALAIGRRLYPAAEYPDGHRELATTLTNLGFMHQLQGQYAAAERRYGEALAMRRRLFRDQAHSDVAYTLANLAVVYEFQGKFAAAEGQLTEALGILRRVHPAGHVDVAQCLINLGTLHTRQGKHAAALPLMGEAIDIVRRSPRGDPRHLIRALTELAVLHSDQGQHSIAEGLHAEALEKARALPPGGREVVATAATNLATVYTRQGKYAAAEPLLKEALEARRKTKGESSGVVNSLNNLAALYSHREEWAAAEKLSKEALDMARRVYPPDHADVATCLNSLALAYTSLGQYAAAEPLLRDALEMRRRVYPSEHPHVAHSLNGVAFLNFYQGRHAAAGSDFAAALEMYRRLATRYARESSEGKTLTLLATLPAVRDGFLSNALAGGGDAAAAYAAVWADKGFVARVYEHRHLRARAAATDPQAAATLADLADARRRRAELLVTVATTDPDTLKQRDADLRRYEARVAELTAALNARLPTIERADRLAAAGPDDLRKVLPPDAAVVDFIRYVRYEQDKDVPGRKGEKRTPRYLAFVVSKAGVAWADLDAAAAIEPAVTAWREAIAGDPLRNLPPAPAEKTDELGARVRSLVWDRVRRALPPGTTTVYVCPDAALCQVPFVALPGDKPGTVLLEDFALATVPHAPFLLDKLSPDDPRPRPAAGVLVVGGVKYDAALPAADPKAVAVRGEPLLKPGAKPGWAPLPATAAEAGGVAAAAAHKKLPVTRLAGEQATPDAVLAALPRVRAAHLATHGFFADPAFRSVLQFDEREYETTRWGERVGRAANSPLVMTGLVLAGANDPKAAARGIVTGEALIDLDLSGLDLAVLSACDTGLGDVAGGQGVFGLQRAFHYAGTRDVVASLWKVPDEATGALMALFYQNLWDKGLSPIEALRRAQLEVYKNPAAVAELAAAFRGKFKEVDAGGRAWVPPAKGGKAPPLVWAAFALSGPGR